MALQIDISQGIRIDKHEELQAKVHLKGGRLVAYSEVISAILLSARAYRVKWVPAQTKGLSSGTLSSVLTAVLGWWAFTGPLWSLTALVWNIRGGVDLTEGLMAAHPGDSSPVRYSDLAAMQRFQEEARSTAMKILVVIVVIIIALFSYAVWNASKH